MYRETKNKINHINNKGYAIVMVIVAIALGMILVGVLLSISVLNYQMKVTEYQSKSNFYSAEVVLDQIYVGLQNEVSEAAGAAYVNAMQSYKTSEAADAETVRITQFNNDYMDAVRSSLIDPTLGDDTKYYIGGVAADYDTSTLLYTKGLCAFLDTNLAGKVLNGSLVITADSPVMGDMNLSAEGLTLKNLKITYRDDAGFYSEIHTDIQIGYPRFSLKETAVIPNVFEYAVIAKDALEFQNSNNTTVGSSVFAGEQGIDLHHNAANVVFHENVDYLISSGALKVDATSSVKLTGNHAWLHSVDVDGGKLEADTELYVVDDMTLKGTASQVTLRGGYYGYSGSVVTPEDLVNGVTAGSQSAIIVNGNKNVLDLTRLRNLQLGGNAFVSASAVDVSGVGIAGAVNRDVLLGTSLTTKSDQIAFLVPAECIGTSGGITLVGKNPMTGAEYEKWQQLAGVDYASIYPDYKLVDDSKRVELLDKSLAEYFPGDTLHYQTVFQNIHGETICYVYLRMNAEQAATYYQDYMVAAEQTMEHYMNRFQNEIKLDAGYTDIDAKGNLVSYVMNGNSLAIVENNLTTGSGALLEAQQKQNQYEKSYIALCSKLTTNYNGLTEPERINNNVYLNLIATTAIDAMTSPEVYTWGTSKAIVCKEDVVVNNQRVTISGSTYSGVRLIITTGNVSVEGDFNGLIISGGVVTVENSTGAVISANKEMVSKLLQTKPVSGSTDRSLIESYFLNGERYAFDDEVDELATYVELDNIIEYHNWTKQ